jgi:hypothetical protein
MEISDATYDVTRIPSGLTVASRRAESLSFVAVAVQSGLSSEPTSTGLISDEAPAAPVVRVEAPARASEGWLAATPNHLPDAMPALLQGSYRAPLATHAVAAPTLNGLSASKRQDLLQVMAPTAIAPLSDYAGGRSFSNDAYALTQDLVHTRMPHALRNPASAPVPQWLLVGNARIEAHPSINLLG